jgi:hypothetical protein
MRRRKFPSIPGTAATLALRATLLRADEVIQ